MKGSVLWHVQMFWMLSGSDSFFFKVSYGNISHRFFSSRTLSFNISLTSILVSCYQFKFNLFRTDWILISSFLSFLQLLFQSSFLYEPVLSVTYFSLSLMSASVLQSCFRPIKYILPVSFDTDNFFLFLYLWILSLHWLLIQTSWHFQYFWKC